MNIERPKNDKNLKDEGKPNEEHPCYAGALKINPPNGSKLEVRNHCLFVDGKPFVVDYPEEAIKGVEDNKLITEFRGHLNNYWSHEDIEGYFA